MRVQRIPVPGLVSCLRLASDGRILVLHGDTRRVDGEHGGYTFRTERTWVTCMDPDGEALWTREFPSRDGLGALGRDRFRLAPDGAAWVLHDQRLLALDREGSVARRVHLPEGVERPVGFVLLEDGFLVGGEHALPLLPGAYRPRLRAELHRLDAEGGILWTQAPLPSERGLPVRTLPRGGGPPRTRWEPWNPGEWIVEGGQVLVSGEVVALGCQDDARGVGQRFGVELGSGRILWETDPRPGGDVAIDAAGHFLLGYQGYGAFDTTRVDRAGELRESWRSHGKLTVDPSGVIRVLEMDNRSDARLHLSVLEPGGAVRQGPRIEGYYAGEPAVSADGQVVFWREGRVQLVEPDGEARVLVDAPAPEDRDVLRGRVWSASPLVIDDPGRVLFGLGRELWILEAGLRRARDAAWECDDGTPLGNPVLGWGRGPRPP